MKKYSAPEMDVIELSVEDVVLTSGGGAGGGKPVETPWD